MNDQLQSFVARLSSKLGMDPEYRYWFSRDGSSSFPFLDVTVDDAKGEVAFGCLWKVPNNGFVFYSQYQALTMDMIQEHFGSQIVVNETDPTILADHFSAALLSSVRIEEAKDDGSSPPTIHLCYDSGGMSFLGSRPLVLKENEKTEINEAALQLILNLKAGQCRLQPDRNDSQIKEVEERFMALWKKNTEHSADPNKDVPQQPAVKRTATSPPTKKTVKRPKLNNKKKKKATGIKFEGED